MLRTRVSHLNKLRTLLLRAAFLFFIAVFHGKTNEIQGKWIYVMSIPLGELNLCYAISPRGIDIT